MQVQKFHKNPHKKIISGLEFKEFLTLLQTMDEEEWLDNESFISDFFQSVFPLNRFHRDDILEGIIKLFKHFHVKFLLDAETMEFSFPVYIISVLLYDFVKADKFKSKIIEEEIDIFLLKKCILPEFFIRELNTIDLHENIKVFGDFSYENVVIKYFWVNILTELLRDKKEFIGKFSTSNLYSRFKFVRENFINSQLLLHITFYFYFCEISIFFMDVTNKNSILLNDFSLINMLYLIEYTSTRNEVGTTEVISTICQFLSTSALVDENFLPLAKVHGKLIKLFLKTEKCKNIFVLKLIINLSGNRFFLKYINYQQFSNKLEKMSNICDDNMDECIKIIRYNIRKSKIASLKDKIFTTACHQKNCFKVIDKTEGAKKISNAKRTIVPLNPSFMYLMQSLRYSFYEYLISGDLLSSRRQLTFIDPSLLRKNFFKAHHSFLSNGDKESLLLLIELIQYLEIAAIASQEAKDMLKDNSITTFVLNKIFKHNKFSNNNIFSPFQGWFSGLSIISRLQYLTKLITILVYCFDFEDLSYYQLDAEQENFLFEKVQFFWEMRNINDAKEVIFPLVTLYMTFNINEKENIIKMDRFLSSNEIYKHFKKKNANSVNDIFIINRYLFLWQSILNRYKMITETKKDKLDHFLRFKKRRWNKIIHIKASDCIRALKKNG